MLTMLGIKLKLTCKCHEFNNIQLEVVDEIAKQPVQGPGRKPMEDIYMTVSVETMKRK